MYTRLVFPHRHQKHMTRLLPNHMMRRRQPSELVFSGHSGPPKASYGAVLSLFEGYLASLSPGCIEHKQVIQRVDKDWHIGNAFTIIIHQPQENFSCVAFCGSGTSWMAFTLRGEGWIPCRPTMNAKYSAEGFINTHFGSFNFIRMLFPGCEDAVCRLDQLRFSNPGYHQPH